MNDMSAYWEACAPYWSYMENNHLDLDSIRQILEMIYDPVLIVGAGQGLLIEELQKNGLKVDGVDSSPKMVKFAKERRGLELVHADGADLPFEDKSYRTTIIATGVIDFMYDEGLMLPIITEAFRVTEDLGSVLIAFYRYHPKVIELMRFIQVLDEEEGIWYHKKCFEMFRLHPFKFVTTVKKEANVGFFKAFLTLMWLHLMMPKKEKTSANNWKRMWKRACQDLRSPEYLDLMIPETRPYRNKDQIQSLFKRLGLLDFELLFCYNCYIVKITKKIA